MYPWERLGEGDSNWRKGKCERRTPNVELRTPNGRQRHFTSALDVGRSAFAFDFLRLLAPVTI
jgi:hypothetical protein